MALLDDGREEVPLRMLYGNINVLLNNVIPCDGISLVHDPSTANGVILMVHGADREVAAKVGFKLGNHSREDFQ